MVERKQLRLAAPSRRGFLAGSAAAAVASLTAAPRAARAGTTGTLRLGLVGCGGRGTGAASQALRADKDVTLVAMGDVFADHLETSLAALGRDEAIAGRVNVPEARRFVGWDAYKEVLAADVDVVLLATPPHFRPLHLAAAVEAGKHVFAEKPTAVDAPGVRQVLEACERARQRKLSVVSGLCFRYHRGLQETVRRIHDGAIGEVRAALASDFRGPIWVKPRQPGWSDFEYQMRNWYYFTWLSGDFNVEQHVHFLDIAAWALGGRYPEWAYGSGGRQARTGPEFGQIYDHHSVVYEYADGLKLFSTCRQLGGGYNDSSVEVVGSKGTAVLSDRRLTITAGRKSWRWQGEPADKFQAEHDELFAGIRRGKPVDNGEYMARSTMMGILGRMATYSGQRVSWQQALASDERLGPDKYQWGPLPTPAVAVPGTGKA
jgi:predicted dehydrogenase